MTFYQMRYPGRYECNPQPLWHASSHLDKAKSDFLEHSPRSDRKVASKSETTRIDLEPELSPRLLMDNYPAISS